MKSPVLFFAILGLSLQLYTYSFQINGSGKVTQRSTALQMRWGLKAKGIVEDQFSTALHYYTIVLKGVANKPTGELPEGVTLRDTVPFELRGFSLPLVVFSVGSKLQITIFLESM